MASSATLLRQSSNLFKFTIYVAPARFDNAQASLSSQPNYTTCITTIVAWWRRYVVYLLHFPTPIPLTMLVPLVFCVTSIFFLT